MYYLKIRLTQTQQRAIIRIIITQAAHIRAITPGSGSISAQNLSNHMVAGGEAVDVCWEGKSVVTTDAVLVGDASTNVVFSGVCTGLGLIEVDTEDKENALGFA